MLIHQNWGGVWDESIPVNKKTIRPLWIVPLRLILNLFSYPWKKNWHDSREYFFTIYGCNKNDGLQKIFLHSRAIFKGQRHHVSWQAEEYVDTNYKMTTICYFCGDSIGGSYINHYVDQITTRNKT